MSTQPTLTPCAVGADAEMADWPALLAQHGRWLRTVALARTGEAQAVEEVMQEIALAVMNSAAGPADPAKTAPWLYRVAVRQALIYRRKLGRMRKTQNHYADRVRPKDTDGRTPDPLAWLIRDEQRQLIRTGLDRLPSRDAEALLLKYIEGWSYTQIAEQLGISHSAIVSRVNRARARLRVELEALNVSEIVP
jgi:RNA polymerase sigma factor (sigma-70 family)